MDFFAPSLPVATGVAFPGAPVLDQRFYRTDRRIEYFWDGTRWLSAQLHHIPLQNSDVQPKVGGNHYVRGANPFFGIHDIWVERFQLATMTDLATSAANYRTFGCNAENGAQVLASALSSQNDAQFVWANKTAAVGQVVAQTKQSFEAYGAPTGAPSSYMSAALTARLIG